MSMSLASTPHTTRAAARLEWASALARYTTERREQLGLTIPAAAELAGLQLSEWLGLEDGWVPDDLATLRAIAGALRVRWTDYSTVAFLARCSQECR